MKNFRKQAQSLIEYGLILALVAIVALTVLTKLGGSVQKAGDNASAGIEETSGGAMETYCKSLATPLSYDKTTGKCK